MKQAAEVIAVLLASQGQHDDAQAAFACTDRDVLIALGNNAIRTAPEHNRTHVAQVVKLALDNPENGGPGVAADFVSKPEINHGTGETWYRAYRKESHSDVDLGLIGRTQAQILRRVVGLYVVRGWKALS